MAALILLAEAVDPLSNGAGWAGAGLLGLVLGWLLFFHLPAKDKQLKELISEHAARSEAMLNRYLATEAAQRDSFARSLQLVIDHCADEMRRIRESFRSD